MAIFKDPSKVKFNDDVDTVLELIEQDESLQSDPQLEKLLRDILQQGLDEDDQFKKEEVKDRLFRDSFKLRKLRPELFPADREGEV